MRFFLVWVLWVATTPLFAQVPVKLLSLDKSIPIPPFPTLNNSSPQRTNSLALVNQWLNSGQNAIQQSEKVRREADLEIQKRQAHQSRVQSILEDASRSFSSPSIQYDLKGTNLPGRERFLNAFQEIEQMLKGQKPLSIKRAVFLSENAFDPSIQWEDFEEELSKMVNHIGLKMQQDQIHSNDPVSKNMMLFRFFTDTLEVNHPTFEKPIVSYPMFYDFEDFWGQKDFRNVFVSKLLKTGTGQCHSLPLLYLILAEEIGAKAHLSFSPSHSYIKFQDDKGNWHNMELTNRMLTSDQFVMYSGYVKAEALANQLYMNPLSSKEVVAQSLNDLAMAYANRYGYDDFIRKCTNLAYEQGLKSMSIHKLNYNYFLAKHSLILNQYKQYGLSLAEFEADGQAMNAYQNLIGAQKHIEKLGYADMPAEQYEKWLNSVQEQGRKTEHQNKMRALIGNRNE